MRKRICLPVFGRRPQDSEEAGFLLFYFGLPDIEGIIKGMEGLPRMTEKTEKNELAAAGEIHEAEKPAGRIRKLVLMPETVRRLKISVIMMLSVINLAGIMIMIPGTPLHRRLFPVRRNPYENTEVRFTGKNGEGTVILYHTPGDEFSGLDYTMTPSEQLYNGDKVIIRAAGVSGYRWDPPEAAVIVSGLADYLTDLSQADYTGLIPVHYNTETAVSLEWDRLKEAGGIQSYKTKPYKIYLFCPDETGENANYLYDAYQTEVVKNDGSFMTVYEAFQYPGVRTRREGELVFRYGTLMNFNSGERYGMPEGTSFSGWLDPGLMEEDLKILHHDFIFSGR